MKQTLHQKALALVQDHKLLRTSDAKRHGVHGSILQRLVEQGKLERVARGIYTLPEHPATANHDLVLAALRVPQGVVCLLSALRYWDMTVEKPFEVWLAYDGTHTRPKVAELPMRLIRFDSKTFVHGVVHETIEGVEVRLTSPAKTVADCFKFRNHIGVDVAVAALKDYRAKRLGTLDALHEAATICRVATVMRPYLESIL